MNPHRPTPRNGVHRTTKLLLTIATVLALAVVIGCSGDEPPPTDHPDKEQQKLEQTIEAVTGELGALQTETATLRHASQTSEPAITNPQTVKTDEEIRTPITAPPPMAVRSATGLGICGRSPQAQQAILRWLRTSSCQMVTEAELYRLSSKQADISFDSAPQEGDFQSLVNLKALTATIGYEKEPTEIAANAFSGMDSLKTLTIYARAEATFREGAFNGLSSLTELRIKGDAPITMEAKSLSGMPALKELTIEMGPRARLMDQAIQDLPSLETLSLNWFGGDDQDSEDNLLGDMGPLPSLQRLNLEETHDHKGKGQLPPIPTNLFNTFPTLQYLLIGDSHPRHGQFKTNQVGLHPNTFARNTELKEVHITGQVTGFRQAFKNLHKLEALLLHVSGTSEAVIPELELSAESPLMKDILSGNHQPQVYKVIL